MPAIEIEYCVPCGFLETACEAERALYLRNAVPRWIA
jgi:hypothetical protein